MKKSIIKTNSTRQPYRVTAMTSKQGGGWELTKTDLVLAANLDRQELWRQALAALPVGSSIWQVVKVEEQSDGK